MPAQIVNVSNVLQYIGSHLLVVIRNKHGVQLSGLLNQLLAKLVHVFLTVTSCVHVTEGLGWQKHARSQVDSVHASKSSVAMFHFIAESFSESQRIEDDNNSDADDSFKQHRRTGSEEISSFDANRVSFVEQGRPA